MATVTTSVEDRRGCGWRVGGGIYLVSDWIGVECDALPIELTVCPVCGCGVKPSRSLAWVTPDALLEGHVGFHGGDEHALFCPLGAPGRLGSRRRRRGTDRGDAGRPEPEEGRPPAYVLAHRHLPSAVE